MKTWTKEERYRVLTSPEEIRPLHELICHSAYRQTFHIQPVTGLLNDPNGFVYHNGVWHLFYQWCPWGAVHGLKYWYHTTSRDLVHWRNEGVCICPDSDQDNKGAYSGSALPGDDALYLFYSGNHREPDWTRISYTCAVKLYDDGRVKKLPHPIFGPHPDFTEHQRDPKIVYVESQGAYYILLGAQSKDKHGGILLYRSRTLTDGWSFAGRLTVPGFMEFGDMWECPSIERISGRDVLIFCPQHLKLPGRGDSIHHNGYLLGTMDWEKLTFTPDGSFHVLDFGFDAYAAECAANLDGNGRAVLSAWMGLPDASYPVTDEEEWSGCLTLPRELRVRGRRLIQTPLPGLRALRRRALDPATRILPSAAELDFFPGMDKVPSNADADAWGDAPKGLVVGAAAETPGTDALAHVFEEAMPEDIFSKDGWVDAPFTLWLFTKPDGSGGLCISYDPSALMVTVDRSGMTNRFNTELGEARSHALTGPLRHLRIFIDHSSIEIFVNDGDAVFSSRVFPEEWERGFVVEGRAALRLFPLRAAVLDNFLV